MEPRRPGPRSSHGHSGGAMPFDAAQLAQRLQMVESQQQQLQQDQQQQQQQPQPHHPSRRRAVRTSGLSSRRQVDTSSSSSDSEAERGPQAAAPSSSRHSHSATNSHSSSRSHADRVTSSNIACSTSSPTVPSTSSPASSSLPPHSPSSRLSLPAGPLAQLRGFEASNVLNSSPYTGTGTGLPTELARRPPGAGASPELSRRPNVLNGPMCHIASFGPMSGAPARPSVPTVEVTGVDDHRPASPTGEGNAGMLGTCRLATVHEEDGMISPRSFQSGFSYDNCSESSSCTIRPHYSQSDIATEDTLSYHSGMSGFSALSGISG